MIRMKKQFNFKILPSSPINRIKKMVNSQYQNNQQYASKNILRAIKPNPIIKNSKAKKKLKMI